MIIKSQNLDMTSSREYSSRRTAQMSITQGTGPDFLKFLSNKVYNPNDGHSYCVDPESIGNKPANKREISSNGTDDIGSIDFNKMNLKVQFKSLNYLLRLFFGKQIAGEQLDLGSYLNSTGGRYQSYNFSETYEESESMTFQTTGTVVTEDGRELNFDLKVGMSRQFYRESNVCYIREQNPLIDPLVINLDSNPDLISDQTFFFDIDADGREDEISSMNAGKGFLALDKNGDGSINDGSELFGAMTGDGFKELAEYDLDGNGWIDEADEIYNKLKVWSMDSSGIPRLATLKESNVGAICLSSVPTKFSMNDNDNNTKAQIRASGFFLREDTGMPGAIQQVDFAKVA